jgi:uncharacterized protein YuzE
MAYFEKDDVLHLAISDEPEAGTVEVSPNITSELNAKGELIGIEILSASTFIRDSVLESVQAKVLDLAEAKTASQNVRDNGEREHRTTGFRLTQKAGGFLPNRNASVCFLCI